MNFEGLCISICLDCSKRNEMTIRFSHSKKHIYFWICPRSHKRKKKLKLTTTTTSEYHINTIYNLDILVGISCCFMHFFKIRLFWLFWDTMQLINKIEGHPKLAKFILFCWVLAESSLRSFNWHLQFNDGVKRFLHAKSMGSWRDG